MSALICPVCLDNPCMCTFGRDLPDSWGGSAATPRSAGISAPTGTNLTCTDLFAGAGGSSTGIAEVPGVTVVMAANHWQLAIDVHNTNHPWADHAAVDLHKEDPRYFPRTDLLWASPECTKWSQANGKALPDIEEGLFEDPLSDEAASRSRLLMFDVLRFAEHHRYRAMVIENVVDIALQSQYATAWRIWREQLAALGYRHRVVSLNSMHAQMLGSPAPQSRDRIYIVCWREGETAPDLEQVTRPRAWCPACDMVVAAVQSWKDPRKTVGRYRAQYVYRCPNTSCRNSIIEPGWIPAATAIDWSIEGQRIGDRTKPLSAKTIERIAAGIARYWAPLHIEAAGNTYDAADPKHPRYGDPDSYYRAWPTDEPLKTLHTTASRGLVVPVEGRDGKQAAPLEQPLRTQTTRAETAMVVPSGGTWNEDARPASDPHRTLTSRDSYALAAAPFLTQFRDRIRDIDPAREPLPTVVADGANHGVVSAPPFVAELRGGSSDARPVTEPAATFTAGGNHHALVMTNQHHNRARGIDEPLPTLTSATGGGSGLIEPALMAPYYGRSHEAKPTDDPMGTLTTVDKYALVHRHNRGGAEMSTPIFEELRTLTTKGHQSLLTQPDRRRPTVTPADLDQARQMVPEVLFRMFQPHEVAAGMAFPTTYRWDVLDSRGRTPSKRDLVKMAGNAVTPPAARDIIAAVSAAITGERVAS